MSEIAIKFENISKQYRLGTIGTGTLSHDLNRWWTMNIRGKEDPYLKIGQVNDRAAIASGDFVWALKDINLEVKQGEVLGIIGKNGAGKSTLLKILSRVTTPTTGRITAYGRIASLLEVGTGFHPEMTGRENIFMNGSIMGMTKAEIKRKFDEIIDFAGIEKYIDTPVKRYSSGMTVRLGFAIAAHLEPEILVVDEVLAVGDAEFQKKAIGKMQDVSTREGRTVLFVSHNMGAISNLCTKGLLLHNGEIIYNSNVGEVISKYLSLNTEKSYYRALEDISKLNVRDVFIKEIWSLGQDFNSKADFLIDEPILIKFNLKINRNKEKYSLFCLILDHRLNRITAAESDFIEDSMILKINPNFLVRGKYSIHAIVNIPRLKQEDVVINECHFQIIDNKSSLVKHGDYDYGSVFGSFEWL